MATSIFSTGDGLFDGPGGTHYGDSVIRLSQGDGVLNFADSFTPYNQAYFQKHDLDVSSGLVQILPQQPDGSQFVLAIDKNGTTYLLDQNNLGGYNAAGDFQIPQELDVPVLGQVHAGLTYWNNTIFVAAENTPLMAYSFSNDQISLQPISQAPKPTANPTGGIVSSNGTQNGIFWHETFPTARLYAYDATNLATELYDSGMEGTRDEIGKMVHFGMPIVANGKVYVDGATNLGVYGLLPAFSAVAGNNQSGSSRNTATYRLASWTDGSVYWQCDQSGWYPCDFHRQSHERKFSTPKTQTNSSGVASTNYTLSSTPGVYTITAASKGYASAIFHRNRYRQHSCKHRDRCRQQSVWAGEHEPQISTQSKSQRRGGQRSRRSIRNILGWRRWGRRVSSHCHHRLWRLCVHHLYHRNKRGAVNITASTAGVAPVTFKATVLAGQPASMAVYAGNNQSRKGWQEYLTTVAGADRRPVHKRGEGSASHLQRWRSRWEASLRIQHNHKPRDCRIALHSFRADGNGDGHCIVTGRDECLIHRECGLM